MSDLVTDLSDDDIRTELTSSEPFAQADDDGTDTEGDADGTDNGDADGTDGGDSDGTDGGDADGTDS